MLLKDANVLFWETRFELDFFLNPPFNKICNSPFPFGCECLKDVFKITTPYFIYQRGWKKGFHYPFLFDILMFYKKKKNWMTEEMQI